MHSPRVYFNNTGSICTDSLRHGNGLSALLLLTRAAKSSAAKSSAAKTRSMESGLKPVFHGAYFGAVSAPTLYAPYPRRVRPHRRLSMERVLDALLLAALLFAARVIKSSADKPFP